MPTPVHFDLPITVRPEHIDEMGHVNNVVYVQWVQDAAAAHWRDVATPEQHAATVWVCIRHEIDYSAPAFDGEELVATTWVDGWSTVTSERHTRIHRPADGTTLASAKTVWCAVHPVTGKPMRVGAELREGFLQG